MRGLRTLIARGGYRLAMGLAAPLWLAAGAMRRADPVSWRRRLARDLPSFSTPPLWLHAASLGEAGVAAILARELRRRYPQQPLLITTFTEAGLARAAEIPGATAWPLPLDLPWIMGRFIAQVRPRALWVVETELWPEMLLQARRRGVAVGMVNARLSTRAHGRYRRVQALFAPLLARLDAVAARSEADARRFIELGARADHVRVCGNVKFDLAVDASVLACGAELRRAWGGRPVWVAGSVRPEEEEAVLAAVRAVRARHSNALMVWAPRHRQRFEAVYQRLCAAGLTVARRSRREAVTSETAVWLLDTLGELTSAYAAADLAFVGGSLSPRYGGHSPLEPALLRRPVLYGPHHAHFREEAAVLRAAGGLRIVHDGAELAAAVCAWLDDGLACRTAGTAAYEAVAANRGAVARSLDWLACHTLGECPDLNATTG